MFINLIQSVKQFHLQLFDTPTRNTRQRFICTLFKTCVLLSIIAIVQWLLIYLNLSFLIIFYNKLMIYLCIICLVIVCRSANGRLNDSGRSAWWFYVLNPLSPLNLPIKFAIAEIPYWISGTTPWDEMDPSTMKWTGTDTFTVATKPIENSLYQITSQTLGVFYLLSILLLLGWLFLSPGTRGDNRYGPAPDH